MQLTRLPLTSEGYMVGDYISTSICDGRAFPVFAVATKGARACALAGPTGPRSPCNERIKVPVQGLSLAP